MSSLLCHLFPLPWLLFDLRPSELEPGSTSWNCEQNKSLPRKLFTGVCSHNNKNTHNKLQHALIKLYGKKILKPYFNGNMPSYCCGVTWWGLCSNTKTASLRGRWPLQADHQMLKWCHVNLLPSLTGQIKADVCDRAVEGKGGTRGLRGSCKKWESKARRRRLVEEEATTEQNCMARKKEQVIRGLTSGD